MTFSADGSAPVLTVGPVSYAATCAANSITLTIADSQPDGNVTGLNAASHALTTTPTTDWTLSSAASVFDLFPEAVLLGDGTAYTADVILALHHGGVQCSARVIAITAG